VRLYDWGPKGYGIVQPVLFTARDGATLSGHIWATRSGPAKRPGIVITNGSVQAPERVYWYAAQTLAKAGYVVMTWDPQGQGLSDTQGEGADQGEGTPAQSDGRPFFDGTEDAINFFLSTPAHKYEPVPSCNSGTSHAAKQDRRVGAGLDSANNPFWNLLDATRLGIAGHSYGAAGVSYIGQWDPRVKTIVAWDNLGSPDPNQPFGGSGGGKVEQGCVDAANRRVVPVTKPALGMSADYIIPPQPNTSQPDPQAKSKESNAYTSAGVDTGELIIRGGTHYDFDWVPNQGFPATLRGADMIDWYTTAWFDKYLKGDCTADRRLLTDRWRHDGEEAAIDAPNHDGNMFSFYYPSRLDIHLADGRRYRNENLRDSGAGLSAADGFGGSYSYVSIARSPDTATTDFGSCPAARPAAPRSTAHCVDARKFRFKLHRAHRARIVKVVVFVNGKRKLTRRGHDIRSVAIARLPHKLFHLKIVSTQSSGSTLVSTRTYRGCRKSRPRTRGHHHR
jgi:dipeptidyl aminopeptidase/acylaminoacyl peptidase